MSATLPRTSTLDRPTVQGEPPRGRATPRYAARMFPVAHPVSGHPHLDVPIALIAAGALLLVLAVGLLVPRRTTSAAVSEEARRDLASWDGELRTAQWVTRGLSLAVLVLGVVAARVGADTELGNLAPALLVGVGWPLVFLGAVLLPGFWRWLDPWDTLGRVLAPGDRSGPGDDVRPAIVLAAAVLWYLAVFPRTLDPRALGAAVLGYTVLTTAGCIVRGRRRWLSTAEPLGIVLTRLGSARPGHAVRETETTGTAALLGVVAGGTLFAVLRRTELWTELVGPERLLLVNTLGLVVCCAAGAGLAQLQVWGTRAMQPAGARFPAVPLVVLGLAPAVAGTVVAVALARNRLTNSLQLLPGLAGDPFGQGWDVLGEPSARPLDAAALLALQLSVLVLAHLWGATLMARRTDRQVRLPAVLLLGQLAAAGVAAVSLH